MMDQSLNARLKSALESAEPGEPGFGAGVAMAMDGELVAEAWIGEAAPGMAWQADTLIVTWSVSKGVAAMLVARLAQGGAIDPDAPIDTYWPGFGAEDKGAITLAEVMTHRAGLPWLAETPNLPSFGDAQSWTDTEAVATALARMRPVDGLVGTIAYHALTYGWLVGECVRRATGDSLNAHAQQLFAGPHGWALGFGTQSAAVQERLATSGIPESGRENANAVDEAFDSPTNKLRRSLCVPVGMSFAEVLRVTQDPAFLAAESPAISLIADAPSLARAYSLFAAGDHAGPQPFIGTQARDRYLKQMASTADDGVTGGARRMALGFVLNSPPSITLSSAQGAFGHPGMGGSLAWGDPRSGLGFAYLTNAAIPDVVTDPRAMDLSRVAMDSLDVIGSPKGR